MKWTPNHIWVLEGLPIDNHHFQYKYVVINNGSPERWEKGFNRIADLKLFGSQDVFLQD
jgi:hypothetical protein